MANHSVNVLIKARDQASRVFGIVGASAQLLRGSLNRTAAVAKFAFTKMLQTAKYAGMGIAAALGYSTFAAIKQEAADIEMASALKVTSQYSTEVMKKFKTQASAIQEATVYGDEYIQTLMRMAITLGISEEKAAAAAKAAVALHAGFGGGRGKPEIFLRYYADALEGNFASLSSYVIELRNATTAEEKQLILQRAIAKGWDVATSKTKSASGALLQMKNTIGDVAEMIGRPLLSEIANSAKAIKRWAENNKTQIGQWADKVANVAILIKDVFADFIKFMREDFSNGMRWSMQSFVKIMKASLEIAIVMAINAGKAIMMGIKGGFLNKKIDIHTEAIKRYNDAGYGLRVKPATQGGIMRVSGPVLERVGPDDPALFEKIKKQVELEFLQKKRQKILDGLTDGIGNSLENLFQDISDSAPKGLKDKVQNSYQKFLDRRLIHPEWETFLQKVDEQNRQKVENMMNPKGGAWGALQDYFARLDTTGELPNYFARLDTTGELPKIGSKAARVSNWNPFESRVMTTAPGQRYDPSVDIARNTKEQKDIAKQQLAEAKKTNAELSRLSAEQYSLEPANL